MTHIRMATSAYIFLIEFHLLSKRYFRVIFSININVIIKVFCGRLDILNLVFRI